MAKSGAWSGAQRSWVVVAVALGVGGCGSEAAPDGSGGSGGSALNGPVFAPAGGTGGVGGAGAIGGTAGVGGAGGVAGQAGAGGAGAGGAAGMAGDGSAGAAGMAGMAGMAGAGGAAGGTPGEPYDGDPSKPVVVSDEVPCDDNKSSWNFKLNGRDAIVDYPCGKHEGAKMTFFLNLHGTTPVSAHQYQRGYFSIHKYRDSHNFIVVTPSSVVQQWGNGDGGVDLPFLLELIDWVYAEFAAFDIDAMWVGGHSWGSMYTNTFVCRAEVADKVKGAVLMSGSSGYPACASKLSVIATAAEDDIGPLPTQGNTPMSHGCDAKQEEMVGNNVHTFWPNCDPGFVHANYFMLGKQHATFVDDVVVKKIADQIKSTVP